MQSWEGPQCMNWLQSLLSGLGMIKPSRINKTWQAEQFLIKETAYGCNILGSYNPKHLRDRFVLVFFSAAVTEYPRLDSRRFERPGSPKAWQWHLVRALVLCYLMAEGRKARKCAR